MAGIVLYLATGLFGITLGYHRLLTHRTFKTPRWVERVLATCGVLSMQRGPLEWVGHHRMHHAHVDTPKDPHSPRNHWNPISMMAATRGLYHGFSHYEMEPEKKHQMSH